MKSVIRIAVTLALMLPVTLRGQQMGPPGNGAPRFAVVPDTRYNTTPFLETILGANWRELWITPVSVPVLDLGNFAGGLTPFRAGGNQSRTLHFRGGDGKRYVFRSTAKFVQRALPKDIADTPAGYLIQDFSSSMHPTAHGAAARLQQALGLIIAQPQLVVMPNDPRLGEWQKDYAGLLGIIEVKADDAEKGDEKYGADKIQGSEKLLENLEESFEFRFDSREYLKARLLDFIIGDTDRGADQWDWARYDRDDVKTYRPIPRDHDYAFMYATGLLSNLVRPFFPKLARYKPGFTEIRDLVFMTQEFDRSQLVELTWADWQRILTDVQSALTDQVFDEAIARLPAEHQRASRDRILAGLRGRRAALPDIVREYYTMVSREAEVFATNADDVAHITRNADGTVRVELFDKKAQKPAFSRTFVPGETVEIRVHLQQGADRAIIRGAAPDRTIKVRVTGGAGDDVLLDSSRVDLKGHHTVFYDSHGRNTVEMTSTTRLSTTEYFTPQPKLEYDPTAEKEQPREKLDVYEERRGRFQDLLNNENGDLVEQKTSSAVHQHWGNNSGWGPAFDYREGGGLMLGVARNITEFGFRHDPYESRMRLSGLYGTNGGFAFEAWGDFRAEASRYGAQVQVRASQLEANRFYGFGNDSERIDRKLALVERDEVLLRPALNWTSRNVIWNVGPIARYSKTSARQDSPADVAEPFWLGSILQAGVAGDLAYTRVDNTSAPTRGFRLQTSTSLYPALLDIDHTYATLGADAAFYLPLGWPSLAFRAGGTRVWGEFPLHDAAFVGGRHTLRGYRWNRFAGDTEAHGSAELRVPVARVTLFTRGQLGLIGLADAGRVWVDGSSPGGWHTSTGAGVSFTSMSRAVSVLWARGEESRFYVQLGLPF